MFVLISFSMKVQYKSVRLKKNILKYPRQGKSFFVKKVSLSLSLFFFLLAINPFNFLALISVLSLLDIRLSFLVALFVVCFLMYILLI